MPVSTKIAVKDKGLIEDLKRISKDLRTEITNVVDQELDSAVEALKSTLRSVLNSDITIASTMPDSTQKVPVGLNIPKTKADLIKFIFGEDITKADYFQRSLGNKTVNENNNIFVYDKGRIKCWQSVGDSSSYSGQENTFRNRLYKGLLIDAKSGSISKIHPDTVRGIKLECSKDTGETVDSEKKFEAYKNSNSIQRRNFDGPYSRTAVWTVKQADAANMLSGALPLNQILEKIQEGDYSLATELLTRNNKGGMFSGALDKIEDLKNGTNVSQDLQIKAKITTLINNLKIRKSVSEYSIKYTLYSTYDSTIEESEDKFFELLKQQIFLWKLSNEDALFKAMMKAANKVIARYSNRTLSE